MSVREFIDSVKDSSSVADVIVAASQRVRAIADVRGKGRPQRVAEARLLRGLLFWLRTGVKPDGLSNEDFQQFRRLAESLVDRGELKPEALKAFDDESPE